jgi:hypothetical protein
VKNNFAKTALVAGIASAFAGQASAATVPATAGDNIIVSCVVPGAGSAAAGNATVWSVDATSQAGTNTLSLPAAVAAGKSCSAALQALNTLTALPNTTVGISSRSFTPLNVAVPSTGYAVQQYYFSAGTNVASSGANVVQLGCNAPSATTGATVYSVDFQGATSLTATQTASVQAVVGLPCSQGIANARSAIGDTNPTSGVTGTELYLFTGGYALTQYTVQ